MTPARFALRPAAELAELEALVPLIDRALGYPRPGWARDARGEWQKLPPHQGETTHYALPEPDQKRARFALRLPELDPDAFPEALAQKLEPRELETVRAALRARQEKPADWTSEVVAIDLEPTPTPAPKDPLP